MENARAPSRVAKSLTITTMFGSTAARLTEWPVATGGWPGFEPNYWPTTIIIDGTVAY